MEISKELYNAIIKKLEEDFDTNRGYLVELADLGEIVKSVLEAYEEFSAVEREAVGEQVNPEEKCDADTHIYYKLKLNKPLCPKCRHGF